MTHAARGQEEEKRSAEGVSKVDEVHGIYGGRERFKFAVN